ncbi:MAG: Cobalamin (Vitamin B12) biosynthesis CbiM protein [Methanothrix sp.]|nr:MAG: Cobalamin (Vitamin B12) biosynthesis CbiM protein [Methanothrix sp.]
MHISDGVLSPSVLVAGYAVAGFLLFITLRDVEAEEIPRISLITAAVFVASLVHFPVGPTSVHLVMNGLAGILLGKRAFGSVFVALTLQALLFQHGGISVIGVNAVNMGVPALLAWKIFEGRRAFPSPKREVYFGSLAAASAVIGTAILLSLSLLAVGDEFKEIAILVLIAHLPIAAIEAGVVGLAAGFLVSVKQEMLVTAVCDGVKS